MFDYDVNHRSIAYSAHAPLVVNIKHHGYKCTVVGCMSSGTLALINSQIPIIPFTPVPESYASSGHNVDVICINPKSIHEAQLR